MKRLVLLLVPVALFAQVVVDTVIRLPDEVGSGFFFPELNKLYVNDYPNGLFVVDCSTYQQKPEILAHMILYYGCSWNGRRQKLYANWPNGPDSTLVIDVAGDSVLRWLPDPERHLTNVYLADIDVRFKPAFDTLYEYECEADTVIRRLPIFSSCVSWDSVGHKLYIGQGLDRKLYVYDYLADSCVKVIDVTGIAAMPDACIFSRTHRRAYVSAFQAEPWSVNVGIIDTEHDVLVKVLPVRLGYNLYPQVAVDERDGKVYITDNDNRYETPDTMWVIDCATDSVLKKFECVPRGNTYQCMRWVPWSNRIYLVNIYPDGIHKSSIVVIDCNTDSVIVPGMLYSSSPTYDIQLDPIHERIFIIGVDTTDVYVLRDTGYAGITGAAPTGPRAAPGLRVQMSSGGHEVSYSIGSPGRVALSVYDLMGREVRQLVAEEQPVGQHSAVWNGTDRNGIAVARGVYFVRLDASGSTDVKKAVVTR